MVDIDRENTMPVNNPAQEEILLSLDKNKANHNNATPEGDCNVPGDDTNCSQFIASHLIHRIGTIKQS